jgi:glycolate oxidase
MAKLDGIEHSTAPEDLVCYGFDASFVKPVSASMVAWPKSTGEVSRIMRHASAHRLAVVGRGAGTGMTAGSVPTAGSIVMSFEKMNSILEVDSGNMTALVEPGVINGNLQRELGKLGFFYPPDPASLNFCTLGGNVAENAGGPRAVKYGVTRDYVMQMEAVLASGEVITAGVKTYKGVVGYDLCRLLIGSEGTLAAITKILLKTLPLPEEVTTLLVSFGDIGASGKAVSGIMSSGIIPRTLEIMDRGAIEAVESYRASGLPSDAEALLLIELDGHPTTIQQEAERVVDICQGLGGSVRQAADEDDRERLWEARRIVSPALHHLNMRKINEDVVVPRSRLPEMLLYLSELSEQSGIGIVNFGHAGDGNIHINIMSSKGDDDEYARAMALVKDIFAKVLDLGGTISGEHGVGRTKAAYIDMEVREHEMELMKGIKRLFDPRGILNPGKIFP